MIDPILESDDKNKDGFIDYPEFIAAQQPHERARHTENDGGPGGAGRRAAAGRRIDCGR